MTEQRLPSSSNMGLDCTLHVVDPRLIRDEFCSRVAEGDAPAGIIRDDVASIHSLAESSPAEAAKAIASAAVRFSSKSLPAAYERGFCLSLWAWRMEKEELHAEVPKKHRGGMSDLDELFAPLIVSMPQLKGNWPTGEDFGNYSTGIYIPPDKIEGLLKWTYGKVKKYPKADRRLFRNLIFVLEEASRRGLGYWEASEVADVEHSVVIPEQLRTPWLEEERFPTAGYWELHSVPTADHSNAQLLFDYSGVDDFLRRQPSTAVADIKTWPPQWQQISQSFFRCARAKDGKWLVIVQRDAHEDGKVAVETLEVRDEWNADGRPIRVPMSDAGKEAFRWQRPGFATADDIPPIDEVGWLGDVAFVVLYYPPHMAYRHRPLFVTGESLTEAAGLPLSSTDITEASFVRQRDGRDVLIWERFGYVMKSGGLKRCFELWPEGWNAQLDGSLAVEEAIITNASFYPEKRSGLFLSREAQRPFQIGPLDVHLSSLSLGPSGALLAKQVGRSPKHLGCLLWPFEGSGGTMLWFDDDLFPDESPDNIRSFVWAETCGKLIAVANERLWAVPIERVLTLPRFDATTGRRLRK